MPSEESARLLVSVTHRLFFSLVVLFTLALVAAIFLADSRHVIMVVVITTGLIGGFVGLQRRLKELTIADLQLISASWIYTCLSPLVGGILALLLYILFLSGLLSGDIFPHFVAEETSQVGFATLFNQHGVDYKDYAKLVFWCFVAGFSEHFVTDVISRFEGEAMKTLTKSTTAQGTPHDAPAKEGD